MKRNNDNLLRIATLSPTPESSDPKALTLVYHHDLDRNRKIGSFFYDHQLIPTDYFWEHRWRSSGTRNNEGEETRDLKDQKSIPCSLLVYWLTTDRESEQPQRKEIVFDQASQTWRIEFQHYEITTAYHDTIRTTHRITLIFDLIKGQGGYNEYFFREVED